MLVIGGYWVDRSSRCFAMELMSGRRSGQQVAPVAQRIGVAHVVGSPESSSISGRFRPFRPFGLPMLLWLLDWHPSSMQWEIAALNTILLRAALAGIVSFALGMAFGPRMVAWLSVRFRERVSSPSPHVSFLHRGKQWTPTMGGLFILAGMAVTILLFGDLRNPYLLLALLLSTGLAAVGAIDDLAKLSGCNRGLSAKAKLIGQTAVALIVALVAYCLHRQVPGALDVTLPTLDHSVSLGMWFVPAAVLVIVGSSNAVNLTDGLDGLAGGCL